MEDEPWHIRRRRQLEAAAPVRRQRQPFVKVPLAWMEVATKATRTPKAMLCVELLYAAWKARSTTFTLPNGRLTKRGISPDTKLRALAELEAGGLITVERRAGKNPIVTLVML